MEENRTNTIAAETTQPIAPPQSPYVPHQPITPVEQYRGAPIPPHLINQPPKQEKLYSGLAFNITSMAIGIITFLIGMASLSDVIEYLFEEDPWYSFGSELSTSVSCLVFGLLCISLAFIGIRKKENAGRSMGAVGVICGGLGIICSVLSIILLVSNY